MERKEGFGTAEVGLNPLATADQLVTLRESLTFKLGLTLGRKDGSTAVKAPNIEISTQ